MKLLFLAAAILAAASMSAQSSQPTSIDPIHSSGAFATAFAFANGSDVSLNVTRSDNSGQTTTFLNFNIFTFGSNSFTDTFAFGQIPNDALKGDNTQHLSLNIDTSQLSSFHTTTCTFSFATFIETCQTGPFGVIQLDFPQNGSFTNRTISDVLSTFFQFQVHTQQNSDSASASPTGSLLGLPIANAFGEIGVHRDTTITLTSTH